MGMAAAKKRLSSDFEGSAAGRAAGLAEQEGEKGKKRRLPPVRGCQVKSSGKVSLVKYAASLSLNSEYEANLS